MLVKLTLTVRIRFRQRHNVSVYHSLPIIRYLVCVCTLYSYAPLKTDYPLCNPEYLIFDLNGTPNEYHRGELCYK